MRLADIDADALSEQITALSEQIIAFQDRASLLEAENRLLAESVQILVDAVWESSQAARYIGRLLLEREEASWGAFEGLRRRLGQDS